MLFDPLVQNPAVKVVASADRAIYTVTWPAQAGATGYFVYAGFDPTYIRSLISGITPLASDTTSFVFNAPTYSPNQILYFWVQALGNSSASPPSPLISTPSPVCCRASGTTLNTSSDGFIDQWGSYTLSSSEYGDFTPNPLSPNTQVIMDGDDQQYFFEEIRRRASSILQDTGEQVLWFSRQWVGLPDPSTQPMLGLDPNYQGMTRADGTFGTGFFPGYFPSTQIRMRFGALPAAMLDFQLPGFRPLLANEAWTNWDPIIHENDLIVRISTGVRYVVTSTAASNYRGVPITQRMQFQQLNFNSQLYGVTDALLMQRWNQVNAAGFTRVGFGTFSTSTTTGANYLLFK